MAEGILTLTLAIFGTVGPPRGCDEAQLATEHVGVRDREVVIADGSPLALVEELYSPLVVFSWESSQSDPQSFGLGLGGRGGRGCRRGFARWRGLGQAASKPHPEQYADDRALSAARRLHYVSCT